MANNQVLIISFWNPTAKYPQQGIFIHEQAAAICRLRENIVFLQVNVLPSEKIRLKKSVEDSAFYRNRQLVVNLYSKLWKLWYVNPWILSRIIYRILKKEGITKPAIIHSNVIFPCGIVGYLLAKRMGSELLMSEHWSKAEKFMTHPLYRRIALRAYKKSYAIICVSEFLRAAISRATGHPNVINIPNIVDTEIFAYRPKTMSPNGKLCLMCIASWKLPKRLDLIFDSVCEYARETTKQIDLIVVGSGVQADLLKKRELPGNLRIRWAGYLDRKEIAGLFQTTHLFLHASEIETFSIVTAEALSTGTPVLASETGALPELISETNGLLTENTVESWLKGIREITAREYDYQAIAQQNQGKYSPETIGKRLLEVYEKIYMSWTPLP